MSTSEAQIRPLGESLGAELTGFDLSAPLTPERAEVLRRAFWANPVLVVRGQELSPEQLVAIGKVFGRLEAHSILHYRHPEHAELSYITNVDKDGNVDSFGQNKRATDWHSDGSFKEHPDSVAFLYSIAAPSSGGPTEFCNMYAAYETLPEALRQRVDGLKAFHKRGEGWRCESPPPPLTEAQKASGEFEGAEHPVVITHPHSGRRALYINPSHCVQVVGMERAASDALLDQLVAHATAERFRYAHSWKVGDILFWDQRCLLHRAGRGTPAGEKRIMLRGMMVDRLSEERIAA
ncbi:MAG: TauD/TfdA family dioxygenase [Geminicoccaceae bacterium]